MKVKDILGGTKHRRHARGPRTKRLLQQSLVVNEGGNVFDDAVDFDHSMIPEIMRIVNDVLKKINIAAIPIGSGATPVAGKRSGDLDLIVDKDQLANAVNLADASEKDIRKKLRQIFDLSGLSTAQSGVSVHVRVPMKDHAHQVDIMVVPNADRIAKFHTHDIPSGSPFKGLNKQLALANLAKKKNMVWSAFQGLFSRNETGKKDKLITDDINEIARILLDNPNASAKDISSTESILRALPRDQAQQLLNDLRNDPAWKEISS